ncbi:MAG TPA: DinB family protein [Chitinophagaceae bacterium]|jgi:uncharacterized damage-inducible protein DinB|nr:DinB family protein [Chitinophagaceae bacterium]
MKLTAQFAKHLRDVHFGGNWTSVNLKDQLAGITWEQATTKLHSFNTIAALTFHINYYVDTILKVMKGEALTAHDKYSFDHPPIQSQQDWEKLLDKVWADAEALTNEMEKFPDEKLADFFVMEKYGTYSRNFQGVIEHTHYHLGQITLIRKLLPER